MRAPKSILFLAAAGSLSCGGIAYATSPKIDDDTCTQLRAEQAKFQQSGILNDINKGAEWAKGNLSPDRLREIQHYMDLDEQVKFGCRDAKLSPDAQKAREAAGRIEINSDADPTAPAAGPAGAPAKNPKKRRGGQARAETDPSLPAISKAPKVKEPKVPKSAAKRDAVPAASAQAPAVVVEDPAKPPAPVASPAVEDGEQPPAASK